jgi:tungstate transport system substrate-binding protein
MDPRPDRSHLHRRVSVGIPVAVAALLALGGLPAPASGGETEDAIDGNTVRLLTVRAANTQHFLEDLVTGFEQESGYDVVVTEGEIDIFDQARASAADIVMAHLGFTELQEFVTEGYGHWPATIMANSVAFISPPNDPAQIKTATDPVEAFARIAEGEHPFVVNNLGETLFITDAVWNAAGRPEKGAWYIDRGLSGPPAVRLADQLDAYTIFGLHPFLMMKNPPPEPPMPPPPDLDAVLYNDALMQRILATVVVKRPPGRVNEEGALALQQYLARPDTQATIRNFRLEGFDLPVFWPAANQNDN